MGKARWCGHGTRFLTVFVLFASLLLTFGAAAIPAGAAAPGEKVAPGDPNLKAGSHQKEWADYYYSLRQTPDGKVSAKARADAVNAAAKLPEVQQLPAATNGKGKGAANPNLSPPQKTWQPLGPQPLSSGGINYSGRVAALAIAPNGTIFLGAADGGVWKSTNNGGSWTPTTDDQKSMAIGALALDQANPNNVIYAGTGEANYALDNYKGVGVLKSSDAGLTWTLYGEAEFLDYSRSIAAIAANGSTVLAATTSGLFRSTTAGVSWAEVSVAGLTGKSFTDVVMDPSNANTVYAVLGSAFGDSSSGVYKSTDGGATFTAMSSGLPAASTFGRTRLAIAASSPQTLYLAIATPLGSTSHLQGIYKTTNGGGSWAATTTPSGDVCGADEGQCWYNFYITVNPSDANSVYVGGIDIIHSTDGGSSWSYITDVYQNNYCNTCGPIHPDQHAAAFGPSGFYAGNDGGIWSTANNGTTWNSLNSNLNTIQFVGGDTTANYAGNSLVFAGSQDNGTELTSAKTVAPWNEAIGGDGYYTGVDKANPQHLYGEFYSGNIYSSTDGGVNFYYRYSTACANLFINPYTLDWNNGNHLIAGGNGHVCESTNGGTSWTTEGTGVFSGSVYSTAISPTSTVVALAGTVGQVYRTLNAGAGTSTAWGVCGSGLPNTQITGVTVDAGNTIYYATVGGFNHGHIFKSVNCAAWTDISGPASGGLPNIPTTSVVVYQGTAGPVIIVATDIGVFITTNNGANWSRLRTGLPNVGVDQVFTDPAHTQLLAATHGRGAWRIAIPAAPTNPDTIGVFRPSNGFVYLANQNSTSTPPGFFYGLANDQPVAGNWTGSEGKKTLGIYRPSEGRWYLRTTACPTDGSQCNADLTVYFGNPSDPGLAVVGDWLGDGITRLGIYNHGQFTLRLNATTDPTVNPTTVTYYLGVAGDIPLGGDWTGKGFDSGGVFRPSNGLIYLRNTNSTGIADITIFYGQNGDKPVVGDWNNDGVTTFGVARGNASNNSNLILLRNENTTGPNDIPGFYLGVNGDVPIAGDWDGLP